MPRRRIDVRFPFGGFDENVAYSNQREGTTRETLNMRGIDPSTGRIRGAQRSGLTRHHSSGTQLSGGSMIQDLNRVTTNNTLLTYSVAASPEAAASVQWSADVQTGSASVESDVVDIKVDAYDNVYVAQSIYGVVKYSSEGGEIAKLPIPDDTFSGGFHVTAVAVDGFQNVFIACSGSAAQGRVFAFEHQPDGTYLKAWTLDPALQVLDVALYQGDLLTLEGLQSSGGNPTEVRLRSGGAGTLSAPDVTADVAVGVDGDADKDARRFSVREDGAVYVAYHIPNGNSSSTKAGLCKISLYADTPAILYAFENDNETAGSTTKYGGLGLGIAVGPTNSAGNYTVYSYGVRDGTGTSGEDDSIVRMLVDTGAAFTVTGGWDYVEGSSEEPLASSARNRTIRIAVDDDGTVYVPFHGYTQQSLIVLDSSGNAQWTDFDTSNIPYAAAVPSRPKPNYQSGAGVDTHEFVYMGGDTALGGGALSYIECRRLVSAAQADTAFRTQQLVGTAGGNIVNFSSTALGSPTNGSGALDSTARYVQSAVLFEKVYFVDGINNKVWTPGDGGVGVDDGSVAEWLGTKSGSFIPKRNRLIAQWRGRLVLAGDPEDPQNWHMSAVEQPNDFNNAPDIPNARQAISGANARAGRCPDVINCIIPYSDDLLLLGGDKSIWRMTGDPMAGGQLDQISDETGIAFGRPYTMDPNGGLYFYGSQGSVYRWVPGSATPERLSLHTIDRRLQDIDQSAYFVRMAWSTRDEGLHVFQCPYNEGTPGGTAVKHWFWEAKTEAWWEDQFASTGVQPTSVMVINGDQGADRQVLIGCEDGRVRYIDGTATDDDSSETTSAIDSYVTIGPIVPLSTPGEVMYQHPEVWLANDLGGAHLTLLGGDEPEDLEIKVERSLGPGRNGPMLIQARADQMYFRLRNAAPGERWAFEKAAVYIASGGKRRAR